MLINLSNHPSENWPDFQIKVAKEKYSTVSDMPFPQIDPEADEVKILDIARDYLTRCEAMLSKANDENHAIHIMGEHTFVYTLVCLLQRKGIHCVASTTTRQANIDENGNKTSRFEFCQFRKYPKI